MWTVQDKVYDGQPISPRELYFRGCKVLATALEEFELKIAALATLVGPRIAYDPGAETVALKQSPDVLRERSERHFGGQKRAVRSTTRPRSTFWPRGDG